MLKKQKIISQSFQAIAYRNIRRPEVDKLLELKYTKKKREQQKELDRAARQLWREIILKSNKL